mgnify:CR=1 FL=1
MTLLEQLKADIPDNHHQQRVYLKADVEDAQRIAARVRELNINAVRYVLRLERFEHRPPEGDSKREAYDILIAALAEVSPCLSQLPAVEKSADGEG